MKRKEKITQLFFIILSLLSCNDLKPANLESTPAANMLFVSASDFSTGSYSAISLQAPHRIFRDIGPLFSDTVVRFNPLDEKIYVLNRLGADNIQVLDPKNNLSTINEFSLAAGSNPQDIAFVSLSKAFVSLYDRSYLLCINPVTGTILAKIDLSPYADADGLPEAHQMLLHSEGGKNYLYLTLQRLNRKNLFQPTDYSLVLIIDPETDQVIQPLTLKGKNPNSRLLYSPLTGAIHVSSVGYYGRYFALDGGIETIIPAASGQAALTGNFLYSEKELGGEVSQFTILPDGSLYAIITDQSFNSFLINRKINTNSAVNVILSTNFQDGGYLSSLILDPITQYLYIADRRPFAPGIWLLDTAHSQFVFPYASDVGLPPWDLAIIP